MLRKLLFILLGIGLVVTSLFAVGVYRNNLDQAWPQDEVVQQSMDAVIEWLEANDEYVLSQYNSALWHMLLRAGEISGDPRLTSFYKRYQETVLKRYPRNIWTPYFEDWYKPAVPSIEEMPTLRPYQLFLVYALSCDEKLGQEKIILEQLNKDYCSFHYLQTRCVTHQQMGVVQIERRNCVDTGTLKDDLAKIIEDELRWDFRVTDSYLQRIMMLFESGNSHRIKPVWIHRILAAQQEDGGWSDFHPLLEMGSLQLGTRSTSLGKGPRKSDIHATAQAVLILAHLQNR